jgi:hypothetical protein
MDHVNALASVSKMLRQMRPTILASFTRGPWDKFETRLDSFTILEKGWDSYNAEPPSAKVIQVAREFLEFLRSRFKPPTKVSPSVVGGVAFTFRHNERSVYVEFRNTGNVHAAFDGPSESDPLVVKVRPDPPGYISLIAKVENHLHEQTAHSHEDERTAR